jgi:dihydrofolate reductase
VVKSLGEAKSAAKEMDAKEVFVIGGGEIYQLALPEANHIYITRVHGNPPGADTFFPEFSDREWTLMSNKDYEADARHEYSYSFQRWDRRK